MKTTEHEYSHFRKAMAYAPQSQEFVCCGTDPYDYVIGTTYPLPCANNFAALWNLFIYGIRPGEIEGLRKLNS